MESTLLLLHIAAGFTALAAAAVAILTKSLDLSHRWHVVSGRIFFLGMIGVFVTAVPLAILRPNPFLFLIAILSFYFALAGWRYATNRRGAPRRIDWASAGVMLLAGGIMIGFGVLLLSRGDSNGVTMVVLGAVGGALSAGDLRTLRAGGVRGTERIARHLTMMMAGTIATVTAFVVTNVEVQPEWIVWLAPTALLTPVIVMWDRRIRSGRKVRGMEG
ncbi:hypothetical protein BH23GEM8_BH23GEM8_09210 [soil metagenome]